VNLLPGSIDTGEAFGGVELGLEVLCAGIGSSESIPLPDFINYTIWPGLVQAGGQLGTPSIDFYFGVTGIASAEAVGTPQYELYVEPVSLASAEAFGAAGAILQVAPAGIPTEEAAGLPNLLPSLYPAAISSGEAPGAPQLNSQVVASGVFTSEALGASLIVTIVSPVDIASEESVPGAFFVGAAVLYMSGIPTQEAVGLPIVGDNLEPAGIESAESFGLGNVHGQITATSVDSGETFGAIQSILQSYVINVPDIIFSAEAFGDLAVLPNITLGPEALGFTPSHSAFTLVQVHALTAVNADTYPTQSVIVLSQAHRLVVEGIDEVPISGQPLLVQDHQLLSEPLAGTPDIQKIFLDGISHFSDPGFTSAEGGKAYGEQLSDGVAHLNEHTLVSGALSVSSEADTLQVTADSDEVTADADDVHSDGALVIHTRETLIRGRSITGAGQKGWRGQRAG
jgi:hypothetical protein